MTKETEAVMENISRIIEGWRRDYMPNQHAERLENLEKYLLALEDYENAKPL